MTLRGIVNVASNHLHRSLGANRILYSKRFVIQRTSTTTTSALAERAKQRKYTSCREKVRFSVDWFFRHYWLKCRQVAAKFERTVFRTFFRLKDKFNMSNSPTGSGRMQIEVLRPIDDFLMGSARYNMPNYQDLEKWNHRIVQNLLYYQTNYIIASLVIVGMFVLWNPSQTLAQILLLALVIGAYAVLFVVPAHHSMVAAQFAELSRAIPQQSRTQVFAGTVGCVVIVLYLMEAILNSFLLVLVPIFLSLVHASLRMRNMNNKMTNLLFQRVRNTPMGWLLQSLDKLVAIEESSRGR